MGIDVLAQERKELYPFACKDREGNLVKPSDFKGKVVYLDIWATWCLPCRAQMPKMKKLKEDYHDKDVVFLYVSVDTERHKWIRFLDNKKPAGVQLMADDKFQNEFSGHYEIYGIPRFMLLDKQGLVYSSDANRPGWPELREDLDKLLSE